MQPSPLLSVTEPRAASPPPPPPHTGQDHQQELATNRRETGNGNSARMPRVPRTTDACPRPWTWDQLSDWNDLWYMKFHPLRRSPTPSEHDDCDECELQFNVFAIENDTDTEEDEEDADARPGIETTPTSKPRSYLETDTSKVEKTEAKSRKAPRRPFTPYEKRRTSPISLHDRKGHIKFWNTPWQYYAIGYDQYLKDFDEEGRGPPETPDFTYEYPDHPHKTPWQRETCRRWDAQAVVRGNAVFAPLPNAKGHD